MNASPMHDTWCLHHQQAEDQASPIGRVCPLCKQRLYTQPPEGNCMSFWESQPGAFTRDGEPCFIYTLVWDDFRIRSLHLAPDTTDERSVRVAALRSEYEADSDSSYSDEGFSASDE